VRDWFRPSTPCKEGAAVGRLCRPRRCPQGSAAGTAPSPTPMRRWSRRRVCVRSRAGCLAGYALGVSDAMLRGAPARRPPWCPQCAREAGRCAAPSPIPPPRWGAHARVCARPVWPRGARRTECGRTRGELCEQARAAAVCSVRFASREAKPGGKDVPQVQADGQRGRRSGCGPN
jgi:hypothetical protein